MAKPLVSAETWQAIKLASISGVPDAKLADYFGVTTGAISSRRYDDPEWQAAKPSLVKPLTGPPKKPTLESQPQAISEVRSDSLAEIGEQNSLLLARYVSQKIKTSAEHDLLPEPSNWAELKTASEILRKATGQDREGAAVSVNLFGGAGSFDAGGPVFEASVIETGALNDLDFC
jgi:hypothetical protein